MTSEGLHKAGDEPAEAAPGTGGTPPPEGAESFNPYRSGGHVPPQQPAAGAAPAPGTPQRGIASAGVPRWPSAPSPRPETGADSGANEWPSQTSWSPNVTPEPPSPPNWGPSPEASAPAQSRWAPAAPDPSAEQPRAFGGSSTPSFGGRASVSGAASVPPPAPATPPSTFGAEPAPYNPYGQPETNDEGESYAEATQHWKGNAYPGAEQAARQQPAASSWAASAEPAQSGWGAAQPAQEQPAYERSGLPPEAWAPAAPAAEAPVSADPNASGRHGLPQREPGQFEPPSESTYSGFDLTKRGAAGGGRAQVPPAPDASDGAAGFGAGAFTRGAAAGHQGVDAAPEEQQPEPWNPPVRVPGASFASTPPPDDPESSRTSMPTSFGGSFNGFGPNNPNSTGAFGEAPPSAGGFEPAAPGEGFGAAPAARGTFGDADGGYRESGPAGYDAPASPAGEPGAFGNSSGFSQAPQGGFNQPPTGGFGQPEPGGFGPAQPGGFNQPQAGGSDGFGQQPGGFGQPESSGFGPAQPGGFNQPQTGGSDGFGQQPGGFGQPESGGFGQPESSGFGPAQPGGFNQPQAGGFGPAASEDGPAGEAGRFAVQPDFGGSYGDQQHDSAQVPQPRTPSDFPAAASPYAPPATGSAGVARAAVVPPSASATAPPVSGPPSVSGSSSVSGVPSVSAPPAGESSADSPAAGRAVAGSASVPMASKITPPPDAPMPPPAGKGQARVYGKAAAPEPDASSPISGVPVSGTPVSGSPVSGASPVSGGSPAWGGYDAPPTPGGFAPPHQEHGPVNGFAHGQQRDEPPADAQPPHFAVGGGLPYPGQVVDGRSIDPRGPMGGDRGHDDRGHDDRGFDDRGFDDQGDGFPGGGHGAGFGPGPQRNDGFGPRNDGFGDGFGAPQQDGFGAPPQQHGGYNAPQDDSPFGHGPGAGGPPSFGSNTAVFGAAPAGFPGNNAPAGFPGNNAPGGFDGPRGFDDAGDADQDAFDKFKAAEPEPAKDPLPAPKKGGNGGVLIAVVIVAALLVLVPLLLVWLISSSQDDSAASFDVPVGGCVQESSGQPVVTECAEPGAFTVVSRAPSKDQCTDQTQPFIEIRTGGEVLCLAPAVPAAGGASAPVTTG
ncbi:hypothetical protein [Catenuloplanes indicus]|uniref:Uncharacterized protein n=1 Tax=Catenuloplanes indicus TaxID=137267 RepID=A0AAE3W1L8_9ACTN|nr:hypothetical protein [Catenuloplanes indicus]MDQ0367866.1 hypothetical protein [Catenuloplanes indicus]